jgi:hypothetical protein
VGSFLEDSVFGKLENYNSRDGVFGSSLRRTTASNGTTVHAGTSLALWIIQLQHQLGHPMADLVMDTLMMASESVDALTDLFESLKGAIQEGLVDMSSVHGVYLRQHCLGFDELSFESSALLWQSLKETLDSLQEGCDQLLKGVNLKMDGNNNFQVSNETSSTASSWTWPLSAGQLQDILHQDCMGYERDALQSITGSGTSTNRWDCRSFEEMEIYIRDMLQKDPELPAAYFLRYLNCVRHGERVGAIDSLHQYFDHAMVSHNGKGNRINSSSGGISRDILQFSAILLAMTHSTFGDSDLALLATEEAVRVAQQSKDAACVAFALGWLYEHHGQGTAERHELLQRCTQRASQGHLRPLLAGSHLTLTKHALTGGDGIRRSAGVPSVVGLSTTTGDATYYGNLGGDYRGGATGAMWNVAWNHLLNVTAEPSTDHRALDRPTFLASNPNETMQGMAMQRLVSMGVWDSVGMPVMSEWASKVTLNRLQDLSKEDVVTAIQNASRLALYGSPHGIVLDDKHSFKDEDRTKDSMRHCVYARAVGRITQLRQQSGIDRGGDLEEPLLHNLSLLFHEWAVNRGDMDDAKVLQKSLASYLYPGLADHDQLYVDIQMQKCLFLYRMQDWVKARAKTKKLLETCKSKNMLKNHARVLIQIALIELESDRKQCTSALSPLLKAIAICEKWEMHGLHAAAMSILAVIFIRLQNPKRAIAILDAVLPTLLQREHVWFQASAYLTLSKAHMKIAATIAGPTRKNRSKEQLPKLPKQSQKQATAIKKRQIRALQALSKCVELFEECHDCYGLRESMYLLAQLHSTLGNVELRDRCSERFWKVCQHLGTGTDLSSKGTMATILDALVDPVLLPALLERSI